MALRRDLPLWSLDAAAAVGVAVMSLHLGQILKAKIAELGITQEQFAKGSGIHFVTLNRLIKGHDEITPREALILGKAFSLAPEFWLHAKADWQLADYIRRKPRGQFKLSVDEAVSRAGVFT